jgi:hypothetical protein
MPAHLGRRRLRVIKEPTSRRVRVPASPAFPPPAGAVRLARRHWMLIVLVTAGLGLRVITQLAYRPALLYIDSYKYLSNASGYDPVGYRVLVDPVLWVGNLALVAAVQHLLGLAMAVTLYTLLIRRHTPRWAATLATAPLLLDAYQLQMEQTIMPDVLFEALILTGLTILLWNPRPGPRTIALGALVLGASADVRQIGEALIVPAVGFAVLMTRGGRRRLGHLAIAAACFGLPVVAYMSVADLTGGGFALTTRGTDIFYGRAAVAANCATLSLPASDRSLCPSPSVAATGIDTIINAADGPYQSYQPPPGETRRQATNDFDLSVLRQQPLAIPLSVARDAIRLFALTRDGSSSITPISRWQFQTTYPFYPPGVTDQGVAEAGQIYGGGGPVTVGPLAVFLRDYQLHGGYTPGPLLAGLTLAGALGSLALFGRRGGLRGPRGPHGWAQAGDQPLAAASALVTLSAVAVLAGADFYEFSWRYQLPALVLLPLAGALGSTVIARRVRHLTVRRAPVPEDLSELGRAPEPVAFRGPLPAHRAAARDRQADQVAVDVAIHARTAGTVARVPVTVPAEQHT